MRELSPNIGDGFVLVDKNSVFVYMTDYGRKALLVEVIVAPGQHHWDWIELKLNASSSIDISDIGNRYSTFDNALNKAVNDSYCTVYEFADFNELAREWENIRYDADSITTVYSSEQKDS